MHVKESLISAASMIPIHIPSTFLVFRVVGVSPLHLQMQQLASDATQRMLQVGEVQANLHSSLTTIPTLRRVEEGPVIAL